MTSTTGMTTRASFILRYIGLYASKVGVTIELAPAAWRHPRNVMASSKEKQLDGTNRFIKLAST
jgi:hypothetical protein